MAILDENFNWHFAEIKGGNTYGAKDANFEHFKGDKYGFLVRESIQNSLDAADDKDNTPVKVTFSFREIPSNNFANFFASLRKHVKACMGQNYDDTKEREIRFKPILEYIDKHSSQNAKMPYLEVSDENTTGMDYLFKDSQETGGFAAFMKGVGVGRKGDVAAGAFGFGKSAFFMLSAINTILVSSKYYEDDSEFFEGSSRLCTHFIDGQKYEPSGFFCNKGDEYEQPISTGIPSRFKRNNAGTTVCVMGLNYDETSKDEAIKRILQAVLFNFWMAVHDKRLEVVIKPGSSNNDIIIDSEKLPSLMEENFPDAEDTDYGHNNPRPYYEAVRWADKDEDKNHILKTDVIPGLGKVRFYLKKIRKENRDRCIFLRKELMYIQQKPYSKYGFYGVFICDGDEGNRALRPAENPPHTEWDKKNCNNDEQKIAAQKALTAINSYIDKILKEEFSTKGKSRLELIDSNHYLYIPTADEDDDSNDNAQTGASTGELKDDGTSPTGATDTMKAKLINLNGSVFTLVDDRVLPSKDGNLWSGHRDGKKRGGKNVLPGNPKNPNKEDPNGKKGRLGKKIQVTFNAWAQKDQNQTTFHFLCVHLLEEPLENGRLRIYSIGEDGKREGIKIKSAWQNDKKLGIDENCIIGIKAATQSVIRLKVEFSDTYEHSLSLEAYEE